MKSLKGALFMAIVALIAGVAGTVDGINQLVVYNERKKEEQTD